MRIRRLVLAFAVAVICCGAILTTAPPARAHNALVGSEPSDGDTVTGPPTEVALGFLEPPSSDAVFAVLSPSGERVDDSVATEPQPFGGYTVTLGLKPLSELGRYTVEYMTVSQDGARLSGTVSFVYTDSAEASGSSGSGPASAGNGSGQTSASNASVRHPTTSGAGEEPGRRLPLGAWLPAPLLLLGAMVAVTVSRRRMFPTPADGPPEPTYCESCGEAATADQAFCVRCGALLR